MSPYRSTIHVWRLIEDGAGEATWNMALDEALLDSSVANAAPPTIRLYSWQRPSISLGRFQNIERTLHRENCRKSAIPLVRRITGGRGILHGDDLTVGIVCPVTALGLHANSSIVEIYTRLANCFLIAFAELGIEAMMGPGSESREQEAHGDCFAIVSRADVIEARTGCKLLGSALHKRDEWILQQISIPLRTPDHIADWRSMAQAVFRGRVDFSDHDEMISLDAHSMERAMVSGLKSGLNIEIHPGQISCNESTRASELSAYRYTEQYLTVPSVLREDPLVHSRLLGRIDN